MLPCKEQQRIPRPDRPARRQSPGHRRCVTLIGEPRAYRVRVGDYRIIYEVFVDRLVFHVVSVGHRRDIYR